MTDWRELLAEYAQNRTESAFQDLVTRYFDLVYSTALRRVSDAHLAQDVAQTVFLLLAKKAPKLTKYSTLGGWLHEATCNVAATVMRSERRRLAREKEAARMNTLQNDPTCMFNQVAPILDDAISHLAREDRTAILLRFFEKRDFRSVGLALGSSEDAARMRVNRALEKLGILLKRGGLTISATALGTILATDAVAAAPVGLAIEVAETLLSSAAAIAVTPSFGLLRTLNAAKMKLAIGCAGLLVLGAMIWNHTEEKRLGAKNAALRLQLFETQKAQAGNRPLVEPQLSQADFRELLRLRGEVTMLRREALLNRSNSLLATALTIVGKPLPRESLVDLGTATPEATVETFFWGLLVGKGQPTTQDSPLASPQLPWMAILRMRVFL